MCQEFHVFTDVKVSENIVLNATKTDGTNHRQLLPKIIIPSKAQTTRKDSMKKNLIAIAGK